MYIRQTSLTVLVFLFLAMSKIAIADVEFLKSDLVACINQQVASEKTKPNPSADKIERECRKQIEALVSELPAELSIEVRTLIRHDIEQELD